MLLFINEDGVDELTPQANNSSVWIVSVGGWLRFSDFPCRKIPFALVSDLSFQSSLHLQRLRRSDVKMDGGGHTVIHSHSRLGFRSKFTFHNHMLHKLSGVRSIAADTCHRITFWQEKAV